MALPDLLDHLLNFLAPAWVVGVLCAALARFMLPKKAGALAWWVQGVLNAAIGMAVLLAGLMMFGRDGKIATYAALVVVCGTCQWMLSGAWRR